MLTPTADKLWQLPRWPLALADDEVHIWRASLHDALLAAPQLPETLSVDERIRAAQYAFAHDQRRFVTARGLLRAILGRYLHQRPHHLRFHYNRFGKPSLTVGTGTEQISFNLSHADDLVLYAVTRSRSVGIDLELVRADHDFAPISARFFLAEEHNAILALPVGLRPAAFFASWTRKEAYVKARGEGLSHPLNEFAVSTDPAGPARLLRTCADPAEANRWSMAHLEPGRGFVGAVAVEGNGWRAFHWQWPSERAA